MIRTDDKEQEKSTKRNCFAVDSIYATWLETLNYIQYVIESNSLIANKTTNVDSHFFLKKL